MDLRRGDVVTVAVPGDYGKPRPAEDETMLRVGRALAVWLGIA